MQIEPEPSPSIISKIRKWAIRNKDELSIWLAIFQVTVDISLLFVYLFRKAKK